MVAISQLHHHEDEEDLPGVVDLSQTGVDHVDAAFQPCFPDVEQRFSEDLKVLDGEYIHLGTHNCILSQGFLTNALVSSKY